MSDNTLIAAEVISAYVTNNSVPASELPDMIRAVVAAFDNLDQPQVVQEPAPSLEPAVPVKKSVHHDYIVSLETGGRFQTLRRHLSSLGMTPDEYRAKWGLPSDYPMTSASYSAKRSQMSKDLGLGRRKAEPVEAPPETAKKPRSTPTAPAQAEVSADTPKGVQDTSVTAQEAA